MYISIKIQISSSLFDVYEKQQDSITLSSFYSWSKTKKKLGITVSTTIDGKSYVLN